MRVFRFLLGTVLVTVCLLASHRMCTKGEEEDKNLM